MGDYSYVQYSSLIRLKHVAGMGTETSRERDRERERESEREREREEITKKQAFFTCPPHLLALCWAFVRFGGWGFGLHVRQCLRSRGKSTDSLENHGLYLWNARRA